jgi:hypothetical protein
MPVFTRLVPELRKADTVACWLDKTDVLDQAEPDALSAAHTRVRACQKFSSISFLIFS